MAYAESTRVPAERSRGEIERILVRYGADAFSYGYEAGRAIVAFRANGMHVKFTLPLPVERDDEIRLTPTGRLRTATQVREYMEKETRRRWRALALVIKAKLEAVESGIVTFEEEFLSHIMLPDGTTVGQTAVPAVALAYETGEMPKLLPAGA